MIRPSNLSSTDESAYDAVPRVDDGVGIHLLVGATCGLDAIAGHLLDVVAVDLVLCKSTIRKTRKDSESLVITSVAIIPSRGGGIIIRFAQQSGKEILQGPSSGPVSPETVYIPSFETSDPPGPTTGDLFCCDGVFVDHYDKKIVSSMRRERRTEVPTEFTNSESMRVEHVHHIGLGDGEVIVGVAGL